VTGIPLGSLTPNKGILRKIMVEHPAKCSIFCESLRERGVNFSKNKRGHKTCPEGRPANLFYTSENYFSLPNLLSS
jgi:hypothetical protein